ncbi:hypothetical protein CDCA_CDCA08G2557 [Cyanidium caldarium]|uniref:SEC7 domain-containing protein n=1 Tax=Cyanidium caldarium TaxID=2771 RepID=A0AAV9IW27_CYACA|nr:hypothetical protein CDCA_CDCA08G2557 [Cyanidium caldarium]
MVTEDGSPPRQGAGGAVPPDGGWWAAADPPVNLTPAAPAADVSGSGSVPPVEEMATDEEASAATEERSPAPDLSLRVSAGHLPSSSPRANSTPIAHSASPPSTADSAPRSSTDSSALWKDRAPPPGSRRANLETALAPDDGRARARNTEVARLIALRGLRRTLETLASRKYAEVTATCRQAVERLESGAEPDCAEAFHALLATVRCGKAAAMDIALDTLQRLLTYGFLDPHRAEHFSEEQFEELVQTACDAVDTKDETALIRITQVLLASATSTAHGLHQSSLLAAIRTLYNIYLSSRSPSTQTTARAATIQIVSMVFSDWESQEQAAAAATASPTLEPAAVVAGTVLTHQAIADAERPTDDATNVPATAATTLEHKDAYLLFRALCKLSSKSMPDTASMSADALPVRSKLLALRLVADVLRQCGRLMSQSERFVYAIREYLVPSVLQNCMLQANVVLSAALDIFELLLSTFRAHLKTEVSAVFHTVVFRFLESPTVSHAQRERVLHSVRQIVDDQQMLMDLFLNYDCDMASPKIFERLVDDLGKLATGALHHGVQRGAAQSIRHAGLECILHLLRSLRDWCEPLARARLEDLAAADGESAPLSTDGGAVNSGSERAADISFGSEGAAATGTDAALVQTLRRKQELSEAVARFNKSPEEGLQWARDHQLLSLDDPAAVARWLRTTAGLDKRQLGEFLGRADDFARQVMHAFTDAADFTDARIDDALRRHLSTFRLPGEAQKIDRIAEKFAQRYCACNANVFASADTAYVLAYSVIMLNTDLHNPQVRKKMTVEDFVRNNRGIDDGADLPRELLVGIYRRIAAQEIRLADSGTHLFDAGGAGGVPDLRLAHAAFLGEQQRMQLFKEESERLLAQTRELFAQRRSQRSQTPRAGEATEESPTAEPEVYFTANNIGHVRLMLEVAWYPLLATFAQLMETTPDADATTVQQCTEGLSIALHIASLFEMETERKALATSIAKFTKLHSLRDVRRRNVECVRILLQVAVADGDMLGETWVDVLRAVSQLERVRAMLAGENNSSTPGATDSPTAAALGPPSPSATSATPPALPPPVWESLQLVLRSAELEQLFPGTVQLSGKGVSDFVQALCIVALEEMENADASSPPRLFCLQKVVEVSHYNMGRIRLEWSRLWRQISTFIESCIRHPNQSVVATYAVESLRQMAVKFLEKPELANFSFQREFLRPFEACMQLSESRELKLYALDCVSQLVHTQTALLKSGWKTAFAVLQHAAEDRSEDVVEAAFAILDSIVRTYFGSVPDVFVDGLHALAVFAANRASSAVAARALEHLGVRAPLMVAEQRTGVPEAAASDLGRLWFPLLTALANMCADEREPLRAQATDLLFRALVEYGGTFPPEFWQLVFRGVLAPIFDDIRHLPGGDRFEAQLDGDVGGHDSRDWAKTTGAGALRGLLTVFEAHFAVMRGLFADMLDLLRNWVCQEHEAVSREGVGCLQRLVDQSAASMSPDEWQQVTRLIDEAVETMTPHEIMAPPTDEGSAAAESPPSSPGAERAAARHRIDFRAVRCKCVVQLLLIQLVREMIDTHYQHLAVADVLALAGSVRRSFAFARAFNADFGLRFGLWRAGFMSQVPNLFRQDTTGRMVYLLALFRLMADERPAYAAPAEAPLREMCLECIREMNRKVRTGQGAAATDHETGLNEPADAGADDDAPLSEAARVPSVEEQREMQAFTPVVCFILERLAQLPDEAYRQFFSVLFEDLVEMIGTASAPEVRVALREVFRHSWDAHLLTKPESLSAAGEFAHTPGDDRTCR